MSRNKPLSGSVWAELGPYFQVARVRSKSAHFTKIEVYGRTVDYNDPCRGSYSSQSFVYQLLSSLAHSFNVVSAIYARDAPPTGSSSMSILGVYRILYRDFARNA